MASGFWKFIKGIKIKPTTSLNASEKGDLEVDNATSKLRFHNGTTASPVVTEDHTATLTNKTLTAPVIATIVNTGTLTLPTSADTLVGRATTDTLTNKTLTSPTIVTPSISGSSGALTLPAGPDTLVGRATTDTLTNKTLTSPTINTPVLSGSGGTLTLPAGPDTLVGRATTDTLTNKTITGNIATNLVSGAATVTLPTTTGTLATLANAETLTNKTLTSPVINTPTISGSGGALTLPAGPDTLVGRATSDTLTNKTLTSPTINTPTISGSSGVLTLPAGPDTLVGWATTDTLTNKTLTSPAITTPSITGSGGALTLPAGPDTLLGRATTDTLTNKSISGATNTLSAIPNSATTAVSTNTNSAIVTRDGSGNFAAGTITANLTGNASGTAASITGNLTGDVTSTGMATTVATVGGSSAANVHSAELLANAAATAATPNTIVKRDGSGNITGVNVTATGTLSVPNGGASIGGAITLAQVATPAAPSAGYTQLYTKADGKIYYYPNGGTETAVGSGSGGGVTGGNNTKDTFTGDGTTTAFTLTATPGNIANTQVYVGGVYQEKSTYSLSLATITFSSAPPVGITIEVITGVTVNSTASPGNYIGNPDFESNATTGWSLKHTTLSSGVPNQVQGSWTTAAGTASIATTTTGKLAGVYSLSYANTVATVPGDMFVSDAFNIDAEYQAKVLSFRFAYSPTVGASTANWSGTGTNSFQVWIYDVANSTWVQPSGCYNLVQSSGVGIASGTFQTASNATSYRFALVNVNATSGAITVLLDDFYCGPQAIAFGAAMSDWKNDKTFTVNNIVSTSPNFWYKQDGDSAKFRGYCIMGSGTAATASISLPFSIDTTKNGIGSNVTIVGYGIVGNSVGAAIGAQGVEIVLFYDGSDASKLYFAYQTTSGVLTKVNGSTITASGNYLMIDICEFPVLGWSSNTQQSSDSDQRLCYATATNNATQTSGSTFTGWVTTADSHAAFNAATGVWTATQTGLYDLNLVIPSFGSGSTYCIPQIVANGTTYSGAISTTSGTTGWTGSALVSVYLLAGQTVSFALVVQGGGSLGTLTNTRMSIIKRQGPAVVQATAVISMVAINNGGAAGANANITTWTTTKKDTNGQFSPTLGTYICPAPGDYFNVFQYQVGTGAPQGQILLNGSIVAVGGSGNNQSAQTLIPNCKAGDVISVQLNSSLTFSVNNTGTIWSLYRLGGQG